MKPIVTALLLSVITINNIQAQSGSLPVLSELISKAIANYPKIKEGESYVNMSLARKDLAYGAYMPVISGDASYRYGKPTPSISIPLGPGVTKDIQFIPANNYDLNLKLQQPVYDFGRTQAGINKAKSEVTSAKDNLEAATNNLAYTVAQLYYGIVFLNKSLEVQQEQINLLDSNETFINNKLKNGDALKYDLLSTQVKKNIAGNRLIDLKNLLHKQYEMLNMFTGDSTYNYIADKEPQGKAFNAADVNPDNNYDIKVLQDRLTTYDWDIKIARRGWLPSIVASASAGYRNGFVPDINKLMFNYNAGVGLNIPIFSAARPNYQTKIAKINLQANTYALEAQKLSLNKDILQAKSEIGSQEQKLGNYELQVQQAQEALSLAGIRYKAGVITNLELLTAQTNLQDALLGKIQLEYNLLLSKLELNRLGGVKFW